MTRPTWKQPNKSTRVLRAGLVEIVVVRYSRRGWEWVIYCGNRELWHSHGRTVARPRTAARHALAWVRKNLGPIADAADDEPGGP